MSSVSQVGEVMGSTLMISLGLAAWNLGIDGLPWLPPLDGGEVFEGFLFIVYGKKKSHQESKLGWILWTCEWKLHQRS